MSVMKTFCGCVSTKTGSLAILGLYLLLALAEIVISSLKIDSGTYGEIKAGFEMPGECNNTDNNNTWWCKVIRNDDNMERDTLIAKICISVIMLVTSFVGFIGVSYDKPKIILPFIIFEFLNILLWISLVVLTVLVLGVYLTTTVDITTTVSVAVIAAIWVVIMLYVWLCVVSHYQILGEVQSMGSDKVKVLQEWEDDQKGNRYDRFGDPDPHADDYPSSGPPSYVSNDDTKIDDVDVDAKDIP